MDGKKEAKGDVWFVYDGDCPICNMAAQALRIRKAVGNLHTLNAREDSTHPLLLEIKARQLSLDDGMVIKFQDTFYHGADALNLMALLGTGQGWFNRMNAWLFRSKATARFCYPTMRAVRNLLLRVKNVPPLRNLKQ